MITIAIATQENETVLSSRNALVSTLTSLRVREPISKHGIYVHILLLALICD